MNSENMYLPNFITNIANIIWGKILLAQFFETLKFGNRLFPQNFG